MTLVSMYGIWKGWAGKDVFGLCVFWQERVSHVNLILCRKLEPVLTVECTSLLTLEALGYAIWVPYWGTTLTYPIWNTN